MPSPSPDNNPPPPRKSNWWNPRHGSWRSPWSLDDDWRDERQKVEPPPQRKPPAPPVADIPPVSNGLTPPPTLAAKSPLQPPRAIQDRVSKLSEPTPTLTAKSLVQRPVDEPPSDKEKPVGKPAPAAPAVALREQPASPPPVSTPPARVIAKEAEVPSLAPLPPPVEKPVFGRSATLTPAADLPPADEQVEPKDAKLPAQSSPPPLPALEKLPAAAEPVAPRVTPEVPAKAADKPVAAEPPKEDAAPKAIEDTPAPQPRPPVRAAVEPPPIPEPTTKAEVVVPMTMNRSGAAPAVESKISPAEQAVPTVTALAPAIRPRTAAPPVAEPPTIAEPAAKVEVVPPPQIVRREAVPVAESRPHSTEPPPPPVAVHRPELRPRAPFSPEAEPSAISEPARKARTPPHTQPAPEGTPTFRTRRPALPSAVPPAGGQPPFDMGLAPPPGVMSAQRSAEAQPVMSTPAPEPHPTEDVPFFRSRRPQPPRAQPPPDSTRETAQRAQPPAESVPPPQRRAMSNPPPAEIVIKDEPPPPKPVAAPKREIATPAEPDGEKDLAPQIGEWPPRGGRTTHGNSWQRLLVFSLVVFAFTVVTWVYWQDDKPPSEETLQVRRDFDDSPQPSAINRMRALLTSVAPVHAAGLVSLPPWQWETPELARMVQENGVARENLRDLLEEPDWHPRHKAWFEEDVGIHGAWTTLALLKQAEAAYLMRRGEDEAAFTVAIDLAELARSLQELHAWPSFYDRSLQIFERASQTLVELLKTTRLDSVRLGEFQNEYVKCAPSDEVLRAAMSAWFMFEKKLMLGPESGEPDDTLPGGIFYQRPGRLFFKPNRTLKLFALSFHDLRDEAEKSPHARSSQLARRMDRMGPGFGLPNSAGEAYFANRIDAYIPLPDRQSIAHAQHAVTTTLFAIRRFQADYKRLPPKLLNLRPDFVKDPPADPFSGAALEYDITKGIVSSVGTNFTPDPDTPAEPPLSDPDEIVGQAGAVQ